MPRFFFDIYDEQGVIPDEEGMDLPDQEAAKREAESSARELLKVIVRTGGMVDERRIEVSDREGVPVATVMLRDLIH